jgi:hypothetical protein
VAYVRSFFAADYAEPDQVGAAPGPAGFRQRLAALRTMCPELELVVTDPLGRGNFVVSRCDDRAPGTIDIRCIEHGGIVERQNDGDLAPFLTPLRTTTVDDPPVDVAERSLCSPMPPARSATPVTST